MRDILKRNEIYFNVKKINGNFGHESICTFAFFRENAELSALNCLITLQRRNLVTGTNGEYKK